MGEVSAIATTVGRRTVFGHRCLIVGATIGDLCEIGNASILMPGATLGRRVFLGEGTLVRYVGYVLEARKARSTESVNCHESDVAETDIHIDLVASPSVRNPCSSITAEMIPHGRPKMWTRPNINKIDRPVRVTGQLMFDAMHDLCKNGKPTQGNPARISLWEIHPVYALDVCRSTSLQACSAGDETVWTPFHKWLEE